MNDKFWRNIKKKWIKKDVEGFRDWLIDLDVKYRSVHISPNEVPASEVQDVWDLVVAVFEKVEEMRAIAARYE